MRIEIVIFLPDIESQSDRKLWLCGLVVDCGLCPISQRIKSPFDVATRNDV